MHQAVAGWRGWILIFLLRYRGYVHTQVGGWHPEWICHVCEGRGRIGVRGSRHGKLGVRPISCGAVFAPAPILLRFHICVNTCDDLE